MVTSSGRRLVAPEYLEALRIICSSLCDTSINWAVTGSCGFALQGVPVTPADIDIQTDRNSAYEIERILGEHVIEKVHFRKSEIIRSHFGALIIKGIRVEIMGDIEKRGQRKTWGKPVDLKKHTRYVKYKGMSIPVLSLEYEYQAYRDLGRFDKAEMLKSRLTRDRQ